MQTLIKNFYKYIECCAKHFEIALTLYTWIQLSRLQYQADTYLKPNIYIHILQADEEKYLNSQLFINKLISFNIQWNRL